MLLELRVRDFGIIEEINWNLSGGLNVITGETGTGKSLVIDAVEALLSGKADEELVRYGAKQAQIEGVFALPKQDKNLAQLRQLLAERGLADGEETLVTSYEIRREGRSIVRVNGHAVPRGLIQQIGQLLIDIHGQSEHLSLFNRQYQLDFLDSYGGILKLRHRFADKATELNKAERELKALAEAEKDLAQREEFLHFQIDEIKKADLEESEEADLERERNILASCEKLKAFSYQVYQGLSGEDASPPQSSTLDRLNEVVEVTKKLVELDPSLKQQLDFLEETLYGLEEVGREIHSYSDRLEYNPKRLEEIETRLGLLRNLKRKYGQTITEILSYLKKAGRELEGLIHSSERRRQLEEQRFSLKAEMGQIASELSKARSKAAGKLETEVRQELQDLNMSQVEFEVSITQKPAPEGIPLPDGENYAFSSEGIDEIEFMASTNPGEPPKPITRIASTGEISRFMLALKGALAQADNIPVLIFDEIDIGVGGRSGEIIGRKLWALAQNRQVICITHLPQIAAYADAHFSVHKEVSGSRTLSKLKTLKDDPRIKELAVMLGGPQYSETALKNAGELAEKARSWKEAERKRSLKAH